MTPLQTKAYALLRQVPRGQVTTYKALAEALHSRAYRAIGQYMKHNPYPYETCFDPDKRIPCHRAISTSGAVGGFKGKSRGKEITQKITVLRSEGIPIANRRLVDISSYLYIVS